MLFKGVNSPVITIMTDSGAIDYPNMEKHINHLVESGLDGLLFMGSIGEFYALTEKEKCVLIDFVVKTVDHRTQVVIGIGDTCFERVVQTAQYAEKAGADAVNIISPYYFGLPAAAAVPYFESITKETFLPIMLYNFPDRSGNDLTPDIVHELAVRCKQIAGVKDTVDNISHTRRVCQRVKTDRPDFSVLSGFDEYYLSNRASGGDGVLCGLTNVAPELFVKMHRAYEAGDFGTAFACAQRVAKLMRLYLTTDLFIVGIKAAVKATGLPISTYTRVPGSPLTDAQFRAIEAILAEDKA